ncbi:hypothetical protein ACFLXD_07075 [Chloroflexota bacterium]
MISEAAAYKIPMMVTEGIGKPVKTAKILHVLLLLAVLIYLDILHQITPPLVSLGSDTLNLVTIILAIIGISDLFLGYFLPRLIIKYRQRKPGLNKGRFLFSVYIVRAAIIEAVAIYGLILGILGASLVIVAPFFIATVAGLLLTFPTKGKWNKMAALIEPLNVKYSK